MSAATLVAEPPPGSQVRDREGDEWTHDPENGPAECPWILTLGASHALGSWSSWVTLGRQYGPLQLLRYGPGKSGISDDVTAVHEDVPPSPFDVRSMALAAAATALAPTIAQAGLDTATVARLLPELAACLEAYLDGDELYDGPLYPMPADDDEEERS